MADFSGSPTSIELAANKGISEKGGVMRDTRLQSAATNCEQCPACGHEMDIKRKLKISVVDLVGASAVISLLTFVLYLVFKGMSWSELIFGTLSLIVVAFIWVFGREEIKRQRIMFGNPWDGVHGAVGILIFAAAVIGRYFVRRDAIEGKKCPKCGYGISVVPHSKSLP